MAELRPTVSDAAEPMPEKAGDVDPVHTDIGLGYFLQSQQMDPAERDVIAKRVLRKIDLCLLPAMCTIYLLSFLDKQTLNYASAYGLKKDLGLVGNQYSWVASVTNIGYLIGSYPSNICLQKLPIGKFISVMLLCWGGLLVATVGAKNFAGLMALRFLLGALEAGIGPAWMLITCMFWTREEQPLRMCFWLGCNGIASILGAGISWGLGHTHNTALASWQLVFLTIGVVTFATGLVALFFFPSSPLDFKLFTEEEKIVSVWRVSKNQTGIKHHKVLTYQIKEAFLDTRVWLVAGQQLAIGIINSSLTNFMSALMAGFGYAPLDTVLWQLPIGAFQLVGTIVAGYMASSFRNTSVIICVLVHLPSFAGILGIALIPIQHRLALTACTWLLGFIGAAIILNWSIIGANFAGHTKRMTINGLNFVCFAAGNVIGPFMFTPSEAPRYMSAIKALCGLYAASIAFTALIGVWMWWQNRKRDAEARSAGLDSPVTDESEETETGFHDMTDKENRNFRYRL